MVVATVALFMTAAFLWERAEERHQRVLAWSLPGTVDVMLVRRTNREPLVSMHAGLDVARCEHLVAGLLPMVDEAYVGDVYIGGGSLPPGPLQRDSVLRLGIRNACASQVRVRQVAQKAIVVALRGRDRSTSAA